MIAGAQYDEILEGAVPSQTRYSQLLEAESRSEPYIPLAILKGGNRFGSVGKNQLLRIGPGLRVTSRWSLSVGGRDRYNPHPTSLTFNPHTSGSIDEPDTSADPGQLAARRDIVATGIEQIETPWIVRVY